MTAGQPGDLLAPLRAHPDTSVLMTDFDGTLSPIVADPDSAAPFDGVTDLLSALAARYLDVVVISGRPVSFLERNLPNDVSLVGLYGLEGRQRGRRWEHPSSGAWREAVGDIAALAGAAGPEGMRVEHKGLSVTLHFRERPDVGDEVLAFARTLAERAGLQMRPARMSVELHPPVDADKGTMVERFAANASGALFAGDDQGDLPAFDGLDRLAAAGAHTVRVGVRSEEAPAELLERADVVVDGPAGAAALLRTLLD